MAGKMRAKMVEYEERRGLLFATWEEVTLSKWDGGVEIESFRALPSMKNNSDCVDWRERCKLPQGL